MTSKVQNIRFLIGVLIVVCIFIMIFISKSIKELQNYDELINCDDKYSSVVPSNFYQELFSIADIGGTNIKTSQDKNVVGFNMPFKAQISFSIIKEKLVSNNWKFTENESNTISTFWKDEGDYTWLFLNCVDVGKSTSVIITLN